LNILQVNYCTNGYWASNGVGPRCSAKVPPTHAGSGTGALMTVQQIGNGTGVATVGTLYYAVQAAAGGFVRALGPARP
jgi:hypothetical protein